MIEKIPYEELVNKYRNASELNKKYVKEIERLNNIINELEKVIIEFKKQTEEERNNYLEIIGNFVDKVRELKGIDKEWFMLKLYAFFYWFIL